MTAPDPGTTAPDPGTSSHVARNREHWETRSADYQGWNRDQLNARWDELGWGVWDLPEDDLHVLGEVDGLDALEYGCGACQSGIKVAKRGAKVTGLDLSGAQLREGLRNMEATGVRFPVVQADGERIPFADASFDLAWCDHGVMSFADPYRTVPEVARVLRPGGLFAFSMVTPIAWIATSPVEDRVSRELKQPYFGIHSLDIDDPDWRTTEFQLPYGEWIRLFRSHGFVIEDLLELRPEPDAVSTYVEAEELPWARDFPVDHIWKVRKG
jgi:SAM-dependent methyltransferase